VFIGGSFSNRSAFADEVVDSSVLGLALADTGVGGLDDTAIRAFAGGMEERHSRIVIDPEICHGQPVIRGLRYPVETMLEYLAGGDSIDDLLEQFPDLEREDLLACLDFAARSVRLRSVHLAAA